MGAGSDTIGARRVANEDGIAETIPSPNLSRNADIMSLSQAAPIKGGQIIQCRPRRAAELSSGVPAVWRCGKIDISPKAATSRHRAATTSRPRIRSNPATSENRQSVLA
jgi:hypothetical protein